MNEYYIIKCEELKKKKKRQNYSIKQFKLKYMFSLRLKICIIVNGKKILTVIYR